MAGGFMGRFIYEDAARIDFDDRVLSHLQVVVGTKLRRGEPFFFTWRDELGTGGGRTSVWLHPNAHLVFKFHGSRSPKLNRLWLDALMVTANAPGGLYLVPEPADAPVASEVLAED
jgi:hypothetical protein